MKQQYRMPLPGVVFLVGFTAWGAMAIHTQQMEEANRNRINLEGDRYRDGYRRGYEEAFTEVAVGQSKVHWTVGADGKLHIEVQKGKPKSEPQKNSSNFFRQTRAKP